MTAVSETGAILSPRDAPESIAPPNNAGCAPSAMPAGKSVRLIALIVPKPEPVLMANKPENRNTTTVNAVEPMLIFPAAHTSPSTMCPSFRIQPYTPTISHKSVAVVAVLLPKNSKMTFQYLSLSSARMAPMIMAMMPTPISRLISTVSTKDRPMAATTKMPNGTRDRNVLFFIFMRIMNYTLN